ncbi:hypothetical protein LWM68_37465 [Niabella sp. W65]|nr:hypothetical protein [Niabella sp. W65]MCH7367940.1 hypothetical protein [Niabella sp. W65]
MIANTLPNVDSALQEIANKVYNGQRISDEDGLYLFEHASLAFAGALANYVREQNMATSPILTAISISNLRTPVFTPAIFVATAVYMHIAMRHGSSRCSK